tara:strand:+ start:376 stop:786 length:411 start_codon:yes stop_codon:yes gene_type:complete
MAVGDIGFIVPNISNSIPVVPDKTLNRQTQPKVRVAKFGDGYQQRIADGLNTLRDTFTVNFVNRLKAEADDIEAFFRTKKAVTAFSFTYPDSNSGTNDSEGSPVTTIKVVCTQWSQSWSNSGSYSITATFERVYEP